MLCAWKRRASTVSTSAVSATLSASATPTTRLPSVVPATPLRPRAGRPPWTPSRTRRRHWRRLARASPTLVASAVVSLNSTSSRERTRAHRKRDALAGSSSQASRRRVGVRSTYTSLTSPVCQDRRPPPPKLTSRPQQRSRRLARPSSNNSNSISHNSTTTSSNSNSISNRRPHQCVPKAFCACPLRDRRSTSRGVSTSLGSTSLTLPRAACATAPECRPVRLSVSAASRSTTRTNSRSCASCSRPSCSSARPQRTRMRRRKLSQCNRMSRHHLRRFTTSTRRRRQATADRSHSTVRMSLRRSTPRRASSCRRCSTPVGTRAPSKAPLRRRTGLCAAPCCAVRSPTLATRSASTRCSTPASLSS
eukprot:PhM_4_TR14423/c0_g1_i1/m.24292